MRITHSQQSRNSSRYYFMAVLACLALIFIPIDAANARSNFTTGDCLQIQDTPDNPFSDGLQGEPDSGEGKTGSAAPAEYQPVPEAYSDSNEPPSKGLAFRDWWNHLTNKFLRFLEREQ